MRVFKKKKKKERRDNCEFFFEAMIIVIFCAYPQRERENGEKPKRLASSQRDWLPHKEDMQQHMGWKEENHAAK